MASKQLYRKTGNTISMPVDSAHVVEAGDMMWQDVDSARSADDFTYVAADLPATQANFAAKFLGVTSEASPAGSTEQITIRRCGVFEFECASATFERGDLVGPDDNAAPDALTNQQVIAIGENGYGAIGEVARQYDTATTRVLVRIFQPVFGAPVPIFLGDHTIGTADEFVTDIAFDFPFKLMKMVTIVTTVTGAGAEVLSIDKNATTLDDTLTIAATAPVGAIDEVVIDDATGDDLFLVGDTLALSGSGGTASGKVSVTIWVRPFNMQVA